MEKISQNEQTKRRKADAALSGRSFFRKKVQIRRNFATTCTQKSTQGAKLQADATFSGRSMVEMLGVLAIIGVLSVGAISGYSKAMMKYKLNKQIEQISTVLNNALIYTIGIKYDHSQSIFNLLVKLNVIPKEMIKDQGKDLSFSDSLNNTIRANCGYSGVYFCSLNIKMDTSNYSVESCRNILTAAKENSPDLWQVAMYKNEGDSITSRTYGDKYCGGYYPCIRDMKLSDIESLCRDCTVDDRCFLQIFWKT